MIVTKFGHWQRKHAWFLRKRARAKRAAKRKKALYNEGLIDFQLCPLPPWPLIWRKGDRCFQAVDLAISVGHPVIFIGKNQPIPAEVFTSLINCDCGLCGSQD